MPYSKFIADIWNSSNDSTYIIEEDKLVTINKDKTIEQVVQELEDQVDSNIQVLESKKIEVRALYFGKTYLMERKKVAAGNTKNHNAGKVDDENQDSDDDDDDEDTDDDNQDAQNPKWDTTGLSSRWNTSHNEPKRKEKQGKRNMIVLTRPITDDDVPDAIKAEYESKKGATCAAEYYTLQLEQKLIEKDKYKDKLEQTKRKGKKSKNEGYTLYMRITHRKILEPEEQEVRSISICCFALYLYILTVRNHTLHVTMIQKSEYQVILAILSWH